MAYTTVPKSTDYFKPEIYTGNGSSKTISTLNFQSDFTWIKNRATTDMHSLFDAVRGATKRISTNIITAQATETQDLTAFNTNGFTVGTSGAVNTNNVNYASWNWKANGQGSSNTDGSINTTYTSASATSGFSISTYTGTGANATFGHGLGVAPKFIMIKRLDNGANWRCYHASIGANYNLVIATDGFQTTPTVWNNTAPSSSLVYLGSYNEVNGSGASQLAYCFADVQGFSKFGSYIGNGNVDGTFIYTGFKPAFVITKNYADSGGASNNGGNWRIFDNQRLGYNVNNATLYPNLSNAEADETSLDLLSNGFKMRGTTGDLNQNGMKYVYMAFASEPLVSTNGNAATAR